MAEIRHDKLLYGISSRLITGKGDGSIRDAFELFGKALGLDGAFLLRTGEIPFLLEVKSLWEPKRNIAGRRILIDYSDDPDWEVVNPFTEEGKLHVVNDTSLERNNRITADFVDNMDIGAYVSRVMMSGNECLGVAVYLHLDKHEWTDKEIDLINEVTDLVSHAVASIRQIASQQYLIAESERAIVRVSEGRSLFMSNLSHEIRTPINSVIGMIAIMRHNLENAEVMSECLGRMETSARQLMDMINDCVDMTLINNNDMSLNNTWVPLNSLIESIRRMVDPLIEGCSLNLETEYDHSLSVLVDEVKLGRVLMNVLTSSCRRVENGTNIYLTIENSKSGGKQNLVTFRIRDEAVGIDGKAAKSIFDPFTEPGCQEALKGSGLSMMITKHLVDLMHGTAEFFSDGWGTETVISIPLEVSGEKTEEKVVEIDNDEVSEFTEMYIGRRIMIAEDNILMGEILATLLGYRGLETEIVYNGQEAYDKYSLHEPFYYDMIFMDIQMPVMDGLEAAKAIRESGRADAGMIPIAALSANAFDEDEQRAIAAGMNAYLRKPVGERELFEAISNLVL